MDGGNDGNPTQIIYAHDIYMMGCALSRTFSQLTEIDDLFIHAPMNELRD